MPSTGQPPRSMQAETRALATDQAFPAGKRSSEPALIRRRVRREARAPAVRLLRSPLAEGINCSRMFCVENEEPHIYSFPT